MREYLNLLIKKPIWLAVAFVFLVMAVILIKPIIIIMVAAGIGIVPWFVISKRISFGNYLMWSLGVAVFVFYFFTAITSRPIGFSRISTQNPGDNYNLLVDGFMAGKLSLVAQPVESLTKLANPYKPDLRDDSTYLWDVSYYNGKYYMYFGATPVVTLMLPFKFLTGRYLPETFGVLFFTYIGFVFSYLLFSLLLSRFFPGASLLYKAVGLVSLAMGPFLPYVLRRPAYYELAIVSGYCFSMMGLYFLFSSRFKD
ncbi:MAG: hypothetical protein AAB116_26995, partial [Candidatus Poribacteria bacterium]